MTKLLVLSAVAVCIGVTSIEASRLTSRPLGRDAILVEIESDSPDITQAGLPRGYHRLTIADLGGTSEPGRPSLPFRTFLVGLPEGLELVLNAKALSTTKLGRFRLAPYIPAPAMGFEQEGALADLAEGTASESAIAEAEDDDLYSRTGEYPDRLAVIHGTGVLRDQRVAEVRVYPVQYSPLDSEVLHHSRIQIRIRFVQSSPDAEHGSRSAQPARIDPSPAGGPEHLRVFDTMLRRGLVNYEMIASERAARRSAATPVSTVSTHSIDAQTPQMMIGGPGAVKAMVIQDGLYQVTPAMLTAAGVDVSMVDPRTFGMTAGGVNVPILVDGESDGTFDPTDRVIFFGKGIAGDRFTRTNVYYLKYNGTAGPRIGARSGLITGGGTTPASFVTTIHAEQNLNYTARIRPGITETWYWGLQARFNSVAGPPMDYAVTVNRIDPVPHMITVRARMLGLTNGNHTPRLLLNGTQIAENTFSGQVNFTQTATVSSTLLVNGVNTITMTMVNNGNNADQIATDYFEIDYRRTYAVDADQLLFDGEGVGTFHFSLTNLGSGDLVLMDVTTPGTPEQITIPSGQIVGGPPFTATVQETLSSDRAYAISTRTALRQPASVVFDFPSNLASPANGADHIVITDRSLLAAMQPLVTHRAAQGLRTALVATDDIYDEFNNGRSSPAAIKSFLTYAYLNWASPAPAYVVLAGDGHIDYTGNLGSGAPMIVPPALLPFPTFGEAPSDNDFVAVVGGDLLPEMFVGRLPIRSTADAAIVVANIIAYETSPPISVLNQRSLFVADNNNPIFQAILNNLQLFMPASMAAATAYLPGGDPPDPNVPAPTPAEITATTDAIIAGFNNGSLLATYFGHGNVTLWASEKILEHNPNPPTGGSARQDANRLTNSGRQSFLVALNCINGYFVDLIPAGPGHADYSLAEEWLRRSNRGAIASWAPSALASVSDYDSIAFELYTHIFNESMTTLGPATVTAMIDAINVFGISTENIKGMHFFGDPATRLALDSDLDGLLDYREIALGTSVTDGDTDDDGISDGAEALVGSTNPLSPDSDGDLLYDGTELGVTSPVTGTNISAGFYVPDADPGTTTNPINADTDGGGVSDGAEDADRNGRVDSGETDPNNPSDDLACAGPLPDVTNLIVTRSGGDVVLDWDPAVSTPCVTYRIYAATNAAYPKASVGAFVPIGDVASPGFIHVGAAANTNSYDYLVRVVHPQLGLGPLGAYGQ